MTHLCSVLYQTALHKKLSDFSTPFTQSYVV